jgi:TM2 domain-containing membrane protein YozV
MNESQEYTLRWRGREVGPYPVSEINRQLDDHKIGLGHEIFYQDTWITLEEFLAVLSKPAASAPIAAPAPTPIGTMPARERISPVRIKVSVSPTPAPESKGRGHRPRYRLVFGLLGVFTGFLGVHNFYARQWLTGLLQLLLSIATYLMGFGIIASWLWAMVEAVFVRKDADGVDMI